MLKVTDVIQDKTTVEILNSATPSTYDYLEPNKPKSLPKKKSKSQRRIDWAKIEQEYVQGEFITDFTDGRKRHIFPTHAELARKHQVNVQGIRQRSCKQKWSLKRDIFTEKIAHKRTAQSINTLLSESARYDAAHLGKIWQVHRLIDLYLSRYADLLDVNTDTNEKLDVDPEDYPPVNMRDLEGMMRLLKESHALVRNIVGEPVNANQVIKEIEEETKLENSTPEVRQARIKELMAKINKEE